MFLQHVECLEPSLTKQNDQVMLVLRTEVSVSMQCSKSFALTGPWCYTFLLGEYSKVKITAYEVMG